MVRERWVVKQPLARNGVGSGDLVGGSCCRADREVGGSPACPSNATALKRVGKVPQMRKTLLVMAMVIALAMSAMAPALAQTDTTVPGHQDRDGVVTGVYDYEVGNWHFRVQYRGDFENSPNLANGWITNHITNMETGQKWFYLIVHETDPRYTGDGTSVWGSWEYHLRVRSNQPDPAANGAFDLNRPSLN